MMGSNHRQRGVCFWKFKISSFQTGVNICSIHENSHIIEMEKFGKDEGRIGVEVCRSGNGYGCAILNLLQCQDGSIISTQNEVYCCLRLHIIRRYINSE